ncbi:MAG: hypothetical protein ACPHL7_04625 [Flavobacteriaceae bacterium]
MKIKLLVLTILTLSWSYAQKNLKKSDVYGKYKLVLNLTNVIESENDDMSLLEEIIVTGITSSIDRLSNDYVNVTFDFRNNNSLFVKIKVKDEKEENEYLRWKIINNKIYIDDSDNPNINIKINGGEEYWILENKNLVKYNKDETRMNGISLIRI